MRKIILILKPADLCIFGNGLIREIQQLLYPVDADLQQQFHDYPDKTTIAKYDPKRKKERQLG